MEPSTYARINELIAEARTLCAEADHIKMWESNWRWRCWLCEASGVSDGAVGVI